MAWSCLFQLQPSSRVCEFVHWGLGEEGEAAKRGPERGRERLERSYVLHFLAAAWERSAPPPLRPVACAASFPCCAIQPHSFLFSLSPRLLLEVRAQVCYIFLPLPGRGCGPYGKWGLKDLLLKGSCTHRHSS